MWAISMLQSKPCWLARRRPVSICRASVAPSNPSTTHCRSRSTGYDPVCSRYVCGRREPMSLTNSIWYDAWRFSLQTMENGLMGMDALLRRVQSVVDQLAGQTTTTKWREAPVEGPVDIEDATADLANRLMRLVLASNRDAVDKCWQALDATLRSLPRNSLASLPHWLALPFQLPLAVGSLTVQEIMRTFGSLPAIRPELWGDFLTFTVDLFSDLPVYFTLQYGAELERYRQYLQHHPN